LAPKHRAGEDTEAAGRRQDRDCDLHREIHTLNISPDPKDEYFADGLAEELIVRLSTIIGFKVIARTSIMRFRGTTKSVGEIGKELKFGTVLEGSVRKAANRLLGHSSTH
jgi:TolB-like protein